VGTTRRLQLLPVLKEEEMPTDPQFTQQLVSVIPALRAFALSMCKKTDLAEDMVQEALTRAWQSQHQFTPDTNFKSWMFTILRNAYYTHYNKTSRMVATDPHALGERTFQPPHQHRCAEFSDFNNALLNLPAGQREALLLVGASGFSIEEAATICGVPEGTIKSRVNRARRALAEFALDGLEFSSVASESSHRYLSA